MDNDGPTGGPVVLPDSLSPLYDLLDDLCSSTELPNLAPAVGHFRLEAFIKTLFILSALEESVVFKVA